MAKEEAAALWIVASERGVERKNPRRARPSPLPAVEFVAALARGEASLAFRWEERPFPGEGLEVLGLRGPRSSPAALLPKRELGRFASLLEELIAALPPLPESPLLKEALELVRAGARGAVSSRGRRFALTALEEKVLLWTPSAHPLAPLLELLPEGGRYEGPLPGCPGAVLEAKVLRSCLVAFPLGLRVGPKKLTAKGGEGGWVPLGDGEEALKLLLEAFGLPEEARAALREGRTEAALRLLALHELAAI